MPLPTIPSGNVASATAGGYTVDNSCRFSGSDDRLVRDATGTSTESNNKWTFSCWVKRGKLGAEQMLVDHRSSGSAQFNIRFMSDDSLQAYDVVGGSVLMQKDTTAKYRDPSAWMHILWSSDRSISSPTTKLWVNGTEVTSWATDNEYSQDDTGTANSDAPTWIGEENSSGSNFEGYLAEMVWLDGTFVSGATDFGEFDSDSPTIWKPIDVSGLTFGTNGWYLDFEDSSNLGNDANGGTDFGETGIAATDQATDTPTNNFCTLNPLAPYGISGTTWSEGNLNLYHLQDSGVPCNFFVNKGKWYWENKIGAESDAQYTAMGIVSESVVASGDMSDASYAGGFTDYGGDDLAYAYQGANGHLLTNDALSSGWGDTYAANDIISVALDLDNNKLYFAKNGTWQNSGDPTSGATGTGAVSITNTYYTPLIQSFSGSSTNARLNFGGGCSWTVSSANSDADGGGTTFEYAPPSGYFALCTKNLANYG